MFDRFTWVCKLDLVSGILLSGINDFILLALVRRGREKGVEGLAKGKREREVMLLKD
jgi:hypothetical protein